MIKFLSLSLEISYGFWSDKPKLFSDSWKHGLRNCNKIMKSVVIKIKIWNKSNEDHIKFILRILRKRNSVVLEILFH